MTHQEATTIVVPVDAQRLASLQAVLATMRLDPGHNPILPFGAVSTCHFGRVVLLPATQDLDGGVLPAQLLLLTDCDGPATVHLQALVQAAGNGVDTLLGHCEGYRQGRNGVKAQLAFLRRHTVPTPANYVRRPGRTVQQIRQEAELRVALQAFVQSNDFDKLSARATRQRLVDFVGGQSEWRWALTAAEGVSWRQRWLDKVDLVARPLGVMAAGPVLLPTALLVLLLVRLQELRDRPPHLRPTAEHVRRLTELEDFAAHNGFTAAGLVKRGVVRQAVLRAVLPLIGWGTRHLFTRDSLAGVKSIHFARWVPLDGGKRVVFASNYDGSLESYNNDFIDIVAWGLNLVFSNGDGYPRTRWLVFDGASREQEFKDFLRRHQIPTPVWYSAYPQLSAVNIERNAALRAGLTGSMSEVEAQKWLRCL